MKIWSVILLMLLIVGIPVFMYWWNLKRSEKVIKTIGDYNTPILG